MLRNLAPTGRACPARRGAQQPCATLVPPPVVHAASASVASSSGRPVPYAGGGAWNSRASWRQESSSASRGAAAGPLRAAGGLVQAQQAEEIVELAKRFYHLSETNDFHDFSKIVAPDAKWRQRGLLQGNCTHQGAEAVHQACLQWHAAYQDLSYTVNMSAQENGRAVLFWTATGANRAPLFGKPATFHRSTFSGVSLVYVNPDGRIRELIEYRQPTHEEMTAFLRKDTGNPVVQRLLLRGHHVPSRDAYKTNAQADSPTIGSDWRLRSLQAATEWVENWTAGPDLQDLVREDMEEYNMYSWPDFEGDLVGKDALSERLSRSAQEAVVIRDTLADSGSMLVAIHWNDFENLALAAQQAQHGTGTHGQGHPNCAPAGSPAAHLADEPGSDTELPEFAIPREQPTLHPEHGSVEKGRQGQLIVHLKNNMGSMGTSMDEPGGTGTRLHKYRGVTLFGIDADCKLAWQLTFRELKASEERQFLARKTASSSS